MLVNTDSYDAKMMDAMGIGDIKAEEISKILNEYLGRNCFLNCSQERCFRVFQQGLLSDLDRKTIEPITSIFPRTKNQLCIVHQIRNSCKYVPYKDRKAVYANLKKIYGAVNLDDAEYAKEEFREKWDKKYPNILKSWDKNWVELTTFFEWRTSDG